tara:strand:- start:315 stop:662 length:348 start_codon:yes stop_codon:yes gene_type:complete
MELDARLLITLAGMIASVVASFVLTRAKCIELEEDIKAIIKRLGHLDNNLDKNDTATQIAEQRVSVLSKMLDPNSREQLHRSLERLAVTTENLQKESDRMAKMHNGEHRPIKGSD